MFHFEFIFYMLFVKSIVSLYSTVLYNRCVNWVPRLTSLGLQTRSQKGIHSYVRDLLSQRVSLNRLLPSSPFFSSFTNIYGDLGNVWAWAGPWEPAGKQDSWVLTCTQSMNFRAYNPLRVPRPEGSQQHLPPWLPVGPTLPPPTRHQCPPSSQLLGVI